MRGVALLGSTGSIGRSTLAVLRRQRPHFRLVALTGGCNRAELEALKAERYAHPVLHDETWERPVLTQPAAIKIACDFAKSIGAVKFFDAGDVQAVGFQVAEDDEANQTVTETGASYMGFAVSALLASGVADRPRYGIAFSGDGAFFMSPQVLVDGVLHGVRGTILLLDNRRMAAISSSAETSFSSRWPCRSRTTASLIRMEIPASINSGTISRQS